MADLFDIAKVKSYFKSFQFFTTGRIFSSPSDSAYLFGSLAELTRNRTLSDRRSQTVLRFVTRKVIRVRLSPVTSRRTSMLPVAAAAGISSEIFQCKI